MIVLGKDKRIQKALVSALFFAIFSYCSQTDDKGGLEPGLILQSILSNPANPQTACVNSTQEAETCLSATGDLDGIQEPNLAGIFSGGTADSYQTYCSQLIGSEELGKFSPKTQECIFSCNEAYWSRAKAEGLCEGDGTDLISRSGVDTLPCVRHCKELYASDPEF